MMHLLLLKFMVEKNFFLLHTSYHVEITIHIYKAILVNIIITRRHLNPDSGIHYNYNLLNKKTIKYKS